MATQTPLRREDEIDRRAAEMFNNHPDLKNAEQSAGVSAGADQAEAYANDPANATQSADVARNAEENPYGYASSGLPTPGGGKQKFIAKITGRKAATGGVFGGIIAAILGLGVLFTPGLAVIHMAETLADDLNDAVPAMDRGAFKVLRAKLKDLGKSGSVCAPGLPKFRCGLKGMTERQIKNFEKAGIEVERGKTNPVTRKSSVKSITFTDSRGNKIPVTNPRQINRMLGDPSIRNQIRRAYNPKFYAVSDKISSKIIGRYGTRENRFKSNSTEENKEKYKEATSGKTFNTNTSTPRVGGTEPTEEQQQQNEEREKLASEIKDSVSGSKGASALMKGGLRGVQVTGALDSACTVWALAKSVEAGAKLIRSQQLAVYALSFMSFAYAQKAGDATPAASTMWGNILTATDTQRQVVNETSKSADAKVDNPYYGKGAFESEGFRAAAYNDAPNLTARAQGMMVGGAMVGTLSGALDKIDGMVSEKTCDFVQNWAVRGLSAAGGLLLGIGSGGASLAASVGASLALSAAGVILAGYLKDIVAGTTVSEDTDGVDSGNALFSGSAVLLGSMAMSRGLQPASVDRMREYQASTQNIEKEYIAMETKDARATPFDITNQYSFLGRFARSVLPVKSYGLLSSLSPTLYLSSAQSLLTKNALAAGDDFNADRFKKCNDESYDKMGVDADIFCNVRFAMSNKEMNMDPEVVYKYMDDKNYVDDEGEPVSGAYQDWFDECAAGRTLPLGVDGGEESDAGIGKDCVDGKSKYSQTQLSNFRVYTLLRTIEEGMDNGPDLGKSTGGITGGSEFRIGSFNLRGASHTKGSTGSASWSERIKLSEQVIEGNDIDVIGFQEFEPSQRDYLKDNLEGYELSTHGKESDSIMWNSDKFTKVDQGTWQTTYFGGPIQEPWVKLADNETGQELYVLSIHDPINRGKGNAESRYQNALKHVEIVKKLQSDAPVFLVGDFNSGFTRTMGAGSKTNEKLAYCVLTKNGFMNNAYDLSIPRDRKCPNPPKKGQKNYIDHIYTTPQVEVESFKEVPRGYTSNGSDHPTIFADVVIPGIESNGAGTEFIMATYNHPVRGNDAVAANAITSHKFDIVGMQELSGSNYQYLRKNLKKSGYAVYPNWNKQRYSQFCSNSRAIFYNTKKFKLVKGSYFDYPGGKYRGGNIPAATCDDGESHDTNRMNAPVIWLQDVATGQTIIAMNIHNSAGGIYAKKRYQSGLTLVKQVEKLKTENPGIPIFLTGDFNEGTAVRERGMGANTTYQWQQADAHKNLLYCMFADNKLMQAVGKPNKCPNPRGRTPVDFIYHTPGVKVGWHKEFRDQSTNDAPHPVVYANLIVPGSGGSGSAEGWVMPIKNGGTMSLKWHEQGSKGLHKGVDFPAPKGTAVFAAHSGKVTKKDNMGSCGWATVIKVDGENNLYMGYQHVDPGVSVGKSVNAGDKIGVVGKFCGTGYHLHFSIETANRVSAYADSGASDTSKDPLKYLPIGKK